MLLSHLLPLCCLLGLGSAWNQPNTCYVRQSSCSSGAEKLDEIQETLASIQQTLVNSFDKLLDVLSQDSTATVTPTIFPSEVCGGPGWNRVAFINMTDLNQNCPRELSQTNYSIRSCGRAHSSYGCSSLIFPVNGLQYSRVCGRATAYRWGVNNAFYGYHSQGQPIDEWYVDGLSLTHGSPRTHIWTFASGRYNGTTGNADPNYRCPCDPGNTFDSFPPFVGNDYFCDSTVTASSWDLHPPQFYSDNALWDGQDLLNPCYGLNNPPWFFKTLSVSTTDDIELRLCMRESDVESNIAVELFEMYIN